jgi:hypothetical protein
MPAWQGHPAPKPAGQSLVRPLWQDSLQEQVATRISSWISLPWAIFHKTFARIIRADVPDYALRSPKRQSTTHFTQPSPQS